MRPFYSLFAAGAMLLLPVTAPAVTTQTAIPVTTVEHTVLAYDAGSMRVMSDNVFTDSEASNPTVTSLGQIVGLDAAKSAPTYTQLEFPFARGASVQTPGVTAAGERFVRVGANPKNLKFTFETPGGVQPGAYAFPESTFNAVGRDPAALKNLGDLPGAPPQYYRILEPPAGTPIQRGIVPGGQNGGVGGVEEVIFPGGF